MKVKAFKDLVNLFERQKHAYLDEIQRKEAARQIGDIVVLLREQFQITPLNHLHQLPDDGDMESRIVEDFRKLCEFLQESNPSGNYLSVLTE